MLLWPLVSVDELPSAPTGSSSFPYLEYSLLRYSVFCCYYKCLGIWASGKDVKSRCVFFLPLFRTSATWTVLGWPQGHKLRAGKPYRKEVETHRSWIGGELPTTKIICTGHHINSKHRLTCQACRFRNFLPIYLFVFIFIFSSHTLYSNCSFSTQGKRFSPTSHWQRANIQTM